MNDLSVFVVVMEGRRVKNATFEWDEDIQAVFVAIDGYEGMVKEDIKVFW